MTATQKISRSSHKLLRQGTWSGDAEHCDLDYEGRFLRRKQLFTHEGVAFLVNLEQTISVNEGDAFLISDGGLVEIRAAIEPLYQITGDRLAALAWHIGNRHTPCAIEDDRLLIRRDAVLASMLTRLGAELTEIDAPFTPEGGAYGMGRTHSHTHGPSHSEPDHAG
ncbi:MAG: urease accessory protein UreE [Pseudomonadota bacterium]